MLRGVEKADKLEGRWVVMTALSTGERKAVKMVAWMAESMDYNTAAMKVVLREQKKA